MMLWGSLVPHMAFRLPVLHCLLGIMTHIVLRFLWQRAAVRLFYMNEKTSMVTP